MIRRALLILIVPLVAAGAAAARADDDTPLEPVAATQLDRIELGVYSLRQDSRLDELLREVRALQRGQADLERRVARLESGERKAEIGKQDAPPRAVQQLPQQFGNSEQLRTSSARAYQTLQPLPSATRRWTHPGNTREELIAHLLSGPHAGHFSRGELATMSYAQLENLHSRDHESMLAPAPRRATLPPFTRGVQGGSPVAARSTVVYYEDSQWDCANGRCRNRRPRR